MAVEQCSYRDTRELYSPPISNKYLKLESLTFTVSAMLSPPTQNGSPGDVSDVWWVDGIPVGSPVGVLVGALGRDVDGELVTGWTVGAEGAVVGFRVGLLV